MKRKYIITALIGFLLVENCPIKAISFETQEDTMNKKCAVIRDENTQKECEEYKEYLQGKNFSFDKDLANIQNEITNAKGDIDKTNKLLSENEKQLETFDLQMKQTQLAIDSTKSEITKMDTIIEEKMSDAKKREILIKNQMKKSQDSLGTNEYIEVLMGTTDFIDLLRRTQAFSEIQEYEEHQIDILLQEKKEIDSRKKTVEIQRGLLEVQQKDISNKALKAKALKEANEALLANYRQQESSLLQKKREVQMQQANIPKIDVSIAEGFDEITPVPSPSPAPPATDGKPDSDSTTPSPVPPAEKPGSDSTTPKPETPTIPVPQPPSGSTYFLSPLAYGWHYEAGTWQYPGGGGHMGMDFSTGLQTGIPIRAPADGIIIYTHNGGCDNSGMSGCGVPWGGGNNTLLLTKKGNTIYAMPFYHLTSASKNAGTRVNQGEIIGYSGNSGNSYGAHTHVEVIRVGNMSMGEALNLYNQRGDVTFGTGWNADSPNACGTAPCRERPESYWL